MAELVGLIFLRRTPSAVSFLFCILDGWGPGVDLCVRHSGLSITWQTRANIKAFLADRLFTYILDDEATTNWFGFLCNITQWRDSMELGLIMKNGLMCIIRILP